VSAVYEVRGYLREDPSVSVAVQNIRAESMEEATALTKQHMPNVVPMWVIDTSVRIAADHVEIMPEAVKPDE